MASSTDNNEMRAQAEGMVSFLIHNEGVPRDVAENKTITYMELMNIEKSVIIMRLWNLEWEKEKAVRGRKIATLSFISAALIVVAIIILIIFL